MMGHPGTSRGWWWQTPPGRPVRHPRTTAAVLAVRGVCVFHLLVGLCTLATGLAGPAHADPRWICEVKLWVLAHDIPFLGKHVEPGTDLDCGLVLPPPTRLRLL